MRCFVPSFAFLGLAIGAVNSAHAGAARCIYFDHNRHRPVARAGVPTPSISPNDLLAGCGHGRYRESATQVSRPGRY